MSHQPNWQEYGKPVAESGDKTAVEVHDGIYGKYQPQVLEAPKAGGTKHDPKPFSISGGATPKE